MEIDLVKMGNGCIMKYHISVVRGTGETLTLEVKSSDTVHDLKYSKLHLEFLRNWIKIFIKTVKEGNITGLEVKSSDTISMVKATTTSDWQVAKPNQRIQRKYQLGDFYAEPKRQPHFPCLIMEHLAKDEEKNVFCSINEEVRESLLNLKNTPYHSRQILYSIEYAVRVFQFISLAMCILKRAQFFVRKRSINLLALLKKKWENGCEHSLFGKIVGLMMVPLSISFPLYMRWSSQKGYYVCRINSLMLRLFASFRRRKEEKKKKPRGGVEQRSGHFMFTRGLDHLIDDILFLLLVTVTRWVDKFGSNKGWSFSLGLTLNSSKFCSRNVRGMWLGFGFSPILLFLLPLLFRRAKGRLLRLLNHIEHVCGQVDFVTSEVVLEQGRL
ncbi:hypothetical protein Tco_1031817 [Tanacetum coccineum]|uniref:Ubiquitin-like domain-containing protein n=1 Tax=Tanacetum coccineum TaxID=301880 RepID=A0ABQ5GAG8_9ASTR